MKSNLSKKIKLNILLIHLNLPEYICLCIFKISINYKNQHFLFFYEKYFFAMK